MTDALFCHKCDVPMVQKTRTIMIHREDEIFKPIIESQSLTIDQFGWFCNCNGDRVVKINVFDYFKTRQKNVLNSDQIKIIREKLSSNLKPS